jgi:hypothetical protein
MEVVILRRGAIIQALRVPDKDGEVADVVLGFDDEEPYKVGGGACWAAAAAPLLEMFCTPPQKSNQVAWLGPSRTCRLPKTYTWGQ